MSTATGRVISLIDDDEIQHFFCRKSLQALGLDEEVLSFFNGSEALDYFSQNIEDLAALPDIIFLDLNMPLLNGWQFLTKDALFKSKINKDVKIYVLSSSIDRDDINKAKAIPEVTGFISKPLSPENLRQILIGD